MGLISTLVDKKINNISLGLHHEITKLMEILKKNLFPAYLIEMILSRCINGALSNQCPRDSLPTKPIFYLKLPYIDLFSVVAQKKDSSALLQ